LPGAPGHVSTPAGLTAGPVSNPRVDFLQ
jgi:hypothetical protein